MEANVVTNFDLFPWQTSDLTNWQPASNLLRQTNGYTLARKIVFESLKLGIFWPPF